MAHKILEHRIGDKRIQRMVKRFPQGRGSGGWECHGYRHVAAYIDAVTTHLPEAVLVFDRFHVMKLFNDKLSDLRRELYRAAKDGLEKDVLKGTRWLLLKRPENLDAGANEHQRLEEALRLNAPLATAYYLKEDLGEFWEQDDQEEAEAFLMDWIARAESTDIRMLHNSPERSFPRPRPPGLLRLRHLHRPPGRHQQQDQDHETPSLRLS